MRTFTVTTEGQNRLGLREVCQRYVDELWLAVHTTPEHAAEAALDTFKRAVLAEIEQLDVVCKDADGACAKENRQ